MTAVAHRIGAISGSSRMLRQNSIVKDRRRGVCGCFYLTVLVQAIKGGVGQYK